MKQQKLRKRMYRDETVNQGKELEEQESNWKNNHNPTKALKYKEC